MTELTEETKAIVKAQADALSANPELCMVAIACLHAIRNTDDSRCDFREKVLCAQLATQHARHLLTTLDLLIAQTSGKAS